MHELGLLCYVMCVLQAAGHSNYTAKSNHALYSHTRTHKYS